MIRLSAINVSRCYFLNQKSLKSIVKFILNNVGISSANLSIVFVTDREIRNLNYLYRKKDKPTDVLSFSMREGRRIKGDSSILGDVVISVDRARKQAKKFGSTFKKEIFLYIIHGILHLLGYNDEKPSSRRRMQRKETEILEALMSRKQR
jgi:probable rRNA maturation factor